VGQVITRRVGRRSGRLGLALVAAAICIGGCASSSPSMLDPRSPEARRIAGLWWLLAGLGAGVYAIVTIAVVAAVVGRRREPTTEVSTDAAPGRHDLRFIVVGGLVLPALVLTVAGVATVRTTNALLPPRGVVHVDVRAEDWWWRLSYPDDDVVTANEIHVPVGRPVELTLTSDNVIHSVWVPQLNGKTDVIPGQVNRMSFTAERAGAYRGQCAEFCGIEHTRMAFIVIAESPSAFERWLAQNRAPAAEPTDAPARAGRDVLETTSCAGCHTVAGTKAAGTLGPDLTHVGSRRSLAADTLPNTAAGMRRWLAATQTVKPGALMPQLDLTDSQLNSLVAYLESLR
jgi:cytochrome c oxidase subunit 2